jgi:peptide/nickel transport system ATP-binding protein
MAAPTPILETVSLVKQFGGGRQLFTRTPVVQAVNGVSIKVADGETFAVVGESGCGKSTLGRLMIRLLDPTSGDVIYRGRNLAGLSAEEMRKLRRELQIIFQDPFASLNPRMTAAQIVGEPIWLHGLAAGGERRDRVLDIFDLVGLRPDMAERYPHEFSGGQRQRIGIARALAGQPQLILGDEPVSALDVSIQAQIINLLEELKERLKLTLVVIAHDLAVIRHMSDHVAVMYLGEVVELAETEELFEAPLHPYSQALLEAIPIPNPRGRRLRTPLQGDIPSPTNPPPGCRFHTRCPHARPVCAEERPVLAGVAGTGRQVACHFWQEIQAAGASPRLAVADSPALAARLALYRARQAGTSVGPVGEGTVGSKSLQPDMP